MPARTFTRGQRLRAIAEVARRSMGRRDRPPEELSQPIFDDEKEAAGFGHMSKARNIWLWLNRDRAPVAALTWGEWVKEALRLTPAQIGRLEGTEARARPGTGTPHYARYALYRLERHLGETPRTAARYSAGLEELLPTVAPDTHRFYPTSNQIAALAGGSFAKAVAELAPQDPSVDRAAAESVSQARTRSMPKAEAIALFVRLHNAWPRTAALTAFMNRSGLRLAADDFTASMEHALEILRSQFPDFVLPESNVRMSEAQLDRVVPAPGDETLDQYRKKDSTAWSREQAVQAVARWLGARDGKSLTQTAYKADRVEHDRSLPSLAEIRELGGFVDIREEALRRIPEASRPALEKSRRKQQVNEAPVRAARTDPKERLLKFKGKLVSRRELPVDEATLPNASDFKFPRILSQVELVAEFAQYHGAFASSRNTLNEWAEQLDVAHRTIPGGVDHFAEQARELLARRGVVLEPYPHVFPGGVLTDLPRPDRLPPRRETGNWSLDECRDAIREAATWAEEHHGVGTISGDLYSSWEPAARQAPTYKYFKRYGTFAAIRDGRQRT